jgi:uncharacterized protein (TIGR03435 family)
MNNRRFPMRLPLAGVAACILLASAIPSFDRAQSSSDDWEKAAGGKMSFEVASVKQNNAEMNGTNSSQNVSLDAGNSFVRTGGLFRATNIPLHWYIRFAYKLETTEFGEIMDELPQWAQTTRYDIEARAPGDPTKDQYRLMMQALLADRFKLAVHFEIKQMPVWGLMLNKPGRLGPKLREHSANPPCPAAAPAGQTVDSTAAGFPLPCGTFVDVRPATEGDYAGGARDVPMSRVADILSLGTFRTYKPVVDETGLAGNYDFVIEFSRDPNDPIGPFQDALKDQLGLKLVPQTGPVQTIAVDHIEQPSPN